MAWTRRRQHDGTADPEIKRKTIGKLFIDMFETEAKKRGGAEIADGRSRSRKPRATACQATYAGAADVSGQIPDR